MPGRPNFIASAAGGALAFGSLTASYQVILAEQSNVSEFVIRNFTNEPIELSFNGTVTWGRVPALTTEPLTFDGGEANCPVYVRYLSVAPTSGWVSVSVIKYDR